jgi:hypothetical protein
VSLPSPAWAIATNDNSIKQVVFITRYSITGQVADGWNGNGQFQVELPIKLVGLCRALWFARFRGVGPVGIIAQQVADAQSKSYSKSWPGRILTPPQT